MNKNILIVLVCLIVIITVATLNSNSKGFTVEVNTIPTISETELSSAEYDLPVTIQTINIYNDYFMSRNYVLPNVKVCLYNSTNNNKRDVDAYYETDASSTPLSNNNAAIRAEVNAHSSKTVSLVLKYVYIPRLVDTPEKNIVNYDQILIVPLEDYNDDLTESNELFGSLNYRYVSCNSFSDEVIDRAVQIDII